MEGCPKENTLIYLILVSLIPGYLFSIYAVGRELYTTYTSMRQQQSLLQRQKYQNHVKLTTLRIYLSIIFQILFLVSFLLFLKSIFSVAHKFNDIDAVRALMTLQDYPCAKCATRVPPIICTTGWLHAPTLHWETISLPSSTVSIEQVHEYSIHEHTVCDANACAQIHLFVLKCGAVN